MVAAINSFQSLHSVTLLSSSQLEMAGPSLQQAINEFGQDPDVCLENIAPHITSFDNLLQFGSAFLDNRVCESFICMAPFGTDSNGHESVRDQLQRMHDLRCYTDGGQLNEMSGSHQQRSYVTFIMEAGPAAQLLPTLLGDDRIWMQCCFSEWMQSPIVKNMPPPPSLGVNLTRILRPNEDVWDECTNMWNEDQPFRSMMGACFYEEYDVGFHEHTALCYIQVCVKEYGAAQESTAIVLEHLEHLFGQQ
jgi:hypothetical protein